MSEIEEKILEFLSDGEKHDTFQVSKFIFGKDGTKKKINPTLYSHCKRKVLFLLLKGRCGLLNVHKIYLDYASR